MFFAITFLVGFLLTAFFSPKPKIENAKAASLSDFNFPRADEGDPVPRWYGTCKFKGSNTIWVGDFEAKAITKKVKTGLFSSKKQTTGYKYYVGLNLAVCLGPGFVFKRLWAGKHELWNDCLFDTECYHVASVNQPNLFGGEEKNGGFVGDIGLYCGDYDQAQDPYLISKIDADVPAYVGIAHMVFRKCYVGNSANIEPIFVEGSLFSNSLGIGDYKHIMSNGLDANPIEVLHDLIVNDWANLNVDPAKINTAQWRAAANVVWNENNGMSIVVANSNTGGEVAKQILRQINGTIFQNPSTGLFDLVLIRKDYVIGDLPIFGPEQISSITNFTKKLWSETKNRVRVKFVDREQDYKEDVIAQADDFANIRFQNRINATEVGYPTVYEADLANQLAARELANLNVPLYQCELAMDRSAGLLPGSVFVLYWPEYEIGGIVMRVRKFGLGTLENGKLTYGVVQDEFASDAVVVAKPVTSNPPADDYAPQELTAISFELPYWLKVASDFDLTAGADYLAFIAKAPSQYSLGYNAVEEDALILDVEPYTANAKLVGALARFAGFNDEGVVPEVVIGSVSDAEALVTTADPGAARLGLGLFYLNGELLSYAEATDEGDGTWTLTDVRRGLVDSGWVGGAIDDPIYFVRDQTGFLPEPGGFDGKLQDVTGQGAFPLPDAAPLALVTTGRADRPYPPDGVRVDDVRALGIETNAGETLALTWIERNRLTVPGEIKFEDDANEAPEVGTVYVVTVEDEAGDTVFTSADIAVAEYDLVVTDEMAGLSTILVWAKLGAVLSYTGAPFPIIVASDYLTIDGGIVLIDDEEVEIA